MVVPRHVTQQLKQLIPPLNGTLHKGQSGRVGVLGGALDYTGAPYFAAISALRLGADLSHVICSPSAAGAIKSYSPDLIVHPILREDAYVAALLNTPSPTLPPSLNAIPPPASPSHRVLEELKSILARLHVLVIGPGLGRESYMQAFAKLAIATARSSGMFLVLDADALLLVGQDPALIRGYQRAVVTPNVVEFKRLSELIGVNPDVPANERAGMVSRKLGGVTVLQKGANDIIATDAQDAEGENINHVQVIDTPGGLKRCGGQGDVLSGAVGTFLAWGKCYEAGAYGEKSIPTSHMPFLAAVGGSIVTRTTSRIAFEKKARSLITEDLIPEIGKAFEKAFGEEPEGAQSSLRL